MKKLSFIVIVLFATQIINAANKYYLSTLGNNANSGTTTASPWQTISQLNTATFTPGDTVFFRCGDVFKGKIVINQSGNAGANIVFTSYGNGAKPIISGAEAVSNWTLSGPATYGNIYQATFTQTPTQFFANNIEKTIARYPNEHVYLSLDNATFTALSDNSLLAIGTATISNSKICIHTRQWCWEKSSVSSVSGSTINFTSPVQQTGLPKYGYFLYDNILHLDTINEWVYDGAGQKINCVMAAGQSPTMMTCEASVASYSNGIEFGSLTKYIKISNLAFEKQSNAGVLINNVNNQFIKIDNCYFARQYNHGVNDKGRYNEISNCYFREVGGIAVFLNSGARKCTVHHNIFRSIGLVRNDGIGQEINSSAIHNSTADSSYFHHNDIDSAGYCGISVDASNSTIERNVVNNAMMNNNDGAAYKSFGPNAFNNVIQNNFANGSSGNREATFQPDFLTPGIYFDFFVNNCKIHNNTIYNHTGRGIFQNSANHHNSLIGNVVYGTDYGIDLNGTPAQTVAITNMTIKRNSLFALNNTAYLIKQIDGVNNNFAMGYIDSNYLFNPYNTNNIAVRLSGTLSTAYNFTAWQGTGFDIKSKKSFVNWISPTNNSTLVTNMTDNVNTYTLNGLYLDLDSNNVCNSITLQPYTSKILINAQQACVNGLHENSLENDLLIYPQPADNFINIELKNNNHMINKIQLYDINGKLIITKFADSERLSINTSNFVSGIYLLKIQDDKSHSFSKIIIINK